MKILLVYPRHQETTTTLSRVLKNKIPPLGLLYAGAALEKSGHEVKIIDAENENLKLEDLENLAKQYQPKIVGFSVTTPTFKKGREAAQRLKQTIPGIITVFGGPHLASFPKISLEFKEIDFGVVGEGEITTPELIKAIENGENFSKVKGIVFRKNGEIIQTEPRELVQNLDELPLPAWHLIDLKNYQDIMSRKKAFATMISSRGCPYNCFWCDPEGRFGKTFRGRSADNIIKEIELLYNQYKIKEVLFYDDTFTVDKQRVVELCNKLINKNWDLIWECRTRVNLVDEELIKLMAAAGCYRIRFGIESGNDEILKFVRKGITKEQARKAVGWCKKYKIEVFTYFMLGLPTETEQTMKETINFSLELDPDYTTFSPTVAFNKGNDLFKWAVEHNYIPRDYWDKFVRGENLDAFPILETNNLSKKTILHYSKMAYKRFYLRFSFIWKKLKSCRSLQNLKKYLSIGLAFLIGKVEV